MRLKKERVEPEKDINVSSGKTREQQVSIDTNAMECLNLWIRKS